MGRGRPPQSEPLPSSAELVRAAWLYYGEGMTQAQVAAQLGVGRARVIALLAGARQAGLVRIRIGARSGASLALEQRLVERFRLEQAIVVPAPAREQDVAALVGHAVGAYLGDRLHAGMSIGVGWGATLQRSLEGIAGRPLERLSVVSLLGSVTHSRGIAPATVAVRLADAFGAECYQLTAPLVVADEHVRDTLWREPGLAELRQRAQDVDLALVSVGDTSREATLFREGLLPRGALRSLIAAGAVGDVLGQFLDARGRPIDHPLARRVVSIGLDEIARVKTIVVASGGRRKVAALAAALAALAPGVLITDETAARGLVDRA